MVVSKTKVLDLIRLNEGKFFTVRFVKQDGTLRTLNGRLGVRYVRKTNRPYRVNPWDPYLTVYDVKKDGYRKVNLERILWIQMMREFVSII